MPITRDGWVHISIPFAPAEEFVNSLVMSGLPGEWRIAFVVPRHLDCSIGRIGESDAYISAVTWRGRARTAVEVVAATAAACDEAQRLLVGDGAIEASTGAHRRPREFWGARS